MRVTREALLVWVREEYVVEVDEMRTEVGEGVDYAQEFCECEDQHFIGRG